ncbi:hypothetical protein MHI43_12360 [Paenibacillus sp. FSL H8-0457]|uniref:hypothetical protein n=1 Tax=Paenibacillus sp. FSL H8-0457 TaxID=2921386 RepID=UPI003100C8B4
MDEEQPERIFLQKFKPDPKDAGIAYDFRRIASYFGRDVIFIMDIRSGKGDIFTRYNSSTMMKEEK